MIRYLIDVYKVEIPENGQRRDDIVEVTEDWLEKHGKAKCYQFQLQGVSLKDISDRLGHRDV